MKRISSTRTRRGFGLLETLICMSLLSLMFLGATSLIISTMRSTVRTQASVYSTGDAANSIQQIIGQLHEASAFALPTSDKPNTAENGWATVGAVPLGQFSTVFADGTPGGQTINTAIEILSPPPMTPHDNGYTAQVTRADGTTGLPYGLRVLSSAGAICEAGTAGSTWAPAPSAQPYNAMGDGGLGKGAVTLVYRGDSNGNPNSASGTYLWQYAMPVSGAFDLVNHPPTALCKSVSLAPNAVQFVRPSYGGIAEQHQMEIKIISSYYSPINGQQTNEQGNGASSSSLTGKCVYMRDHYAGGGAASQAPTNTRTGNNAFQYH